MHLRNLNPYVATALEDWDHQSVSHPSAPRQAEIVADAKAIAGTSSFGMSGVNAHVLLGPSDGFRTLLQVCLPKSMPVLLVFHTFILPPRQNSPHMNPSLTSELCLIVYVCASGRFRQSIQKNSVLCESPHAPDAHFRNIFEGTVLHLSVLNFQPSCSITASELPHRRQPFCFSWSPP